MGCEKCNISKNPTYKKCMNCWKKKESIEDELRVLSVDVSRYTFPTINYNYTRYYNTSYNSGSVVAVSNSWVSTTTQ